MASLPYAFAFKILTFKKPFEDLDVSWFFESEEKVKMIEKLRGLKLIDLLINKQFPIIILSGSLIISCLKKGDQNVHACIQNS